MTPGPAPAPRADMCRQPMLRATMSLFKSGIGGLADACAATIRERLAERANAGLSASTVRIPIFFAQRKKWLSCAAAAFARGAATVAAQAFGKPPAGTCAGQPRSRTGLCQAASVGFTPGGFCRVRARRVRRCPRRHRAAAAAQTRMAAAQLDRFSLREKPGLGQCSQKAPFWFAPLNAA